MKSGLKVYLRNYLVIRIYSCTHCRDEKRTESYKNVRVYQAGILVALTAAMKSGLKGTAYSQFKLIVGVALTAAMKSGLKVHLHQLGQHFYVVALTAAMKSGLKVHLHQLGQHFYVVALTAAMKSGLKVIPATHLHTFLWRCTHCRDEKRTERL